ncbi:glycoside hydrolase family 3 protein [Anaerolineales bacterium]
MLQFMRSFQGTSAPDDILEGIALGDIGAICLFAYTNVRSPEQLRRLTDQLHQTALDYGHLPPLIGIDQEGGQLMAITTGATELPGNMALGATRSPELARLAGKVIARELLAMGINFNFAPVLDVNVNPANPAIGIRSFGDDPALVGELGAAMIAGMQAEGVIATAKHFPGHGDTEGDSHYEAPVVHHNLEQIEEIDLYPFQQAIQAGVQSIMTSHILYPALDNENPATLSPAILKALLREKMGFNGMIVSDAMDMHAVSRLGSEVSLSQALDAGNDLITLGHITDQAYWAAHFKHKISSASVQRIQTLRKGLHRHLPPVSSVGSLEHKVIAQHIADASITQLRDRQMLLPLRLKSEQSIAVITVKPQDLTPADTSSRVQIRLANAVQKRHANTQAYELTYQASRTEIADILNATAEADVVIVGTISSGSDPSQGELVRAIHDRGQDLIVGALRIPYDIMDFPMISTYLCAYGIRDLSTEALTRVIFGEIRAQGILPCHIPDIEVEAN